MNSLFRSFLRNIVDYVNVTREIGGIILLHFMQAKERISTMLNFRWFIVFVSVIPLYYILAFLRVVACVFREMIYIEYFTFSYKW